MLWGVAVPIESRIRELGLGRMLPETRIIKGEEQVVDLVGSFMARAASSTPPAFAYGISDKESTRRAAGVYHEPARRLFGEHPDFKILHITDIQRENLDSVKTLVRAGYEVRHVDGNRIRLSVSKGEYLETIHSREPGGIPDEILWSTDPQLVAQGTRIFDSLWSHALPSELRIREIEDGVGQDTMKIIRNPDETQALYSGLVAAAKYDILLLLPTSNAFHRDEKIGIMDSIRTVAEKGTRVSILSPIDDLIAERYADFILPPNKEQGVRTDEGRAVSLRRIPQAKTQSAVSILVVDGTSTLIMEERNPSSPSFTDALGFATFSTTSPTVRSSIRFFERMRDETDLRESKEAALEKERNTRRQAELLQDILSHDIRNYNQVARANAEMLRMDLAGSKSLEGDADSLIETIIRATDGSTELIDRAKKLSRALSTQATQLRPTDVGASLQRAISLVTKAYVDKAITLSQSVPEGASVLADELLDEVFTNILSNAVKYTPGRDVSVWVKAEEDGGRSPPQGPGAETANQTYWKVGIADRGRGIPDQMKEKVFTRYATASSGSGLGLSIVHALVTGRYRGKVKVSNRVENSSSEGTLIEVWLPGAF